jgi:DNA-binding response OmpR family regulator
VPVLGEEPIVLLVDDDTDVLELHEIHLKESCDVKTATGGEEALELIDDSVDVVLLDRRMPELSGDEVVGTFRDRGYDMPVGMVSAINPSREILEVPIDAYRTKPIGPEELLETVKMLALRVDFDATCREYFRLALKKTILEATTSMGTDDSAAIQQVTTRMKAIRENTTKGIDDLDPKAIINPAGFEELSEQVQEICLSTPSVNTDVQT